MHNQLTTRQIKLLEAIIKEYSETSNPVGSKTVVKKYSLKVSPATVRNEMANLLDEGFLEMMHTSSGRIPTSRAFRFFIEEMMEEDELPVLQEVALKQKLWPQRFEFEKLFREAALSLSEVTENLVIAMTSGGFVSYAGAYQLMDKPEFEKTQTAKNILKLIDRNDLLREMFERLVSGSGITVAIGDEIGYPGMERCALVATPFSCGKKTGYVSVLGPSRMNYSSIVPAVRYSGNLIEELVGNL